MTTETENIEFKAKFTEDLYKEIIAFANTDGGIVYIGIDNDGTVRGLDQVDQEYTRITNGIRDAIMPDVTLFVRYTVQENKVVRIEVSEGTNKPYYLKSKGLKVGLLTREVNGVVLASLKEIGAEQICPKADLVTPELVRDLHSEGFSVRAWGVRDEAVMEQVLRCGADGMTVNFPDKLLALLNENE